jgi:pyridoxamine 5'-phosphate oxidase
MFGKTPPKDPIATFQAWLEEAEAGESGDPTAMAVATVGADGMPSVRMLLLKGVDERGFVFYTNFESRKGGQLLAHPKAALETVSDAEADAYFASRPRQTRIGAWASDQSRPMKGRFDLEKRVAEFGLKYAIGEIPRPPHWSGFRIVPRMIEFWQEGAFRLHQRLVYHRDGDGWRTERLYP